MLSVLVGAASLGVARPAGCDEVGAFVWISAGVELEEVVCLGCFASAPVAAVALLLEYLDSELLPACGVVHLVCLFTHLPMLLCAGR